LENNLFHPPLWSQHYQRITS